MRLLPTILRRGPREPLSLKALRQVLPTVGIDRRSFLTCSTMGAVGSLFFSSLRPNEELLEVLPFENEFDRSVEVQTGSGLGGRLAVDLSRLGPDHLIVPNERFFIRTLRPDLLPPTNPWSIRVHGLGMPERNFPVDELRPWSAPQGVHLAECSGNGLWRCFGLISAARWEGVPIARLLEAVDIPRQAAGVRISGFDRHSSAAVGSTIGASWIFKLDDLRRSDGFLALRMNGEALPIDHGFPVRFVMPGWYGCCWPKWVDEIELVARNAPATAQMKEFAGRTHQKGTPRRALDFSPALIDVAAMPIRVEMLKVNGQMEYRVTGIVWGGLKPTEALSIRFGSRGAFQPLESCRRTSSETWSLWTHTWRPRRRGLYPIRLRVDDPSVRTRRLDMGYYQRTVRIDEPVPSV